MHYSEKRLAPFPTEQRLHVDDSAHGAMSLLAQYDSIRHRLTALRHAGCAQLLRLLPAFFAPLPRASEALRCEVLQLEDYGPAVANLSRFLGFPANASKPIDHELLQRLTAANRACSGSIGIPDLLFLHAFITVLAPPRVVELGTLTGFSASVIAAAVAQQQSTRSGTLVDTIDLNRHCLTDVTKPVGFEISRLVPELAARIRVHPGRDAQHLASIATKGELPFVFIDADHQHPRPTLDLLRVAPFVRAKGWIMLHDIELARVTEQMRAARVELKYQPSYGAQWLFDAWPFAKISGGNIGALQMPAKLRDLRPFAVAMLRIPSELKGVSAQRTAKAFLAEAAKLVNARDD
jgi:predicted O-methyltransferase YrrM